MEHLVDFLEEKSIPFVKDPTYVFACGFVFYTFEENLACNNPDGRQFTHLSVSDADRLIKRQLRKVPTSLHKPFYRQ